MKMKKIIAGVSTFLIAVSAIPFQNSETFPVNTEISANAASKIIDEGKCGEKASFTIDADGVLTISGSGLIDDSAFNCDEKPEYLDKIKSLVVEDGISGIGMYAFYRCRNLESAVLPDSVTQIFMHAFYGCSGLKSLNFPQYLTLIDSYAFAYSGLEKIELPSDVVIIADHSFEGCGHLTDVKLPENLLEIENNAFYNCIELKSIVIPEHTRKIGNYVFQKCEKLSEITIPKSVKEFGVDPLSFCSPDLTIISSEKSVAYEYAMDRHMPFQSIEGGDEKIVYTGFCGDNIKWKITKEGVLTLSGKGDMINYVLGSDSDLPNSPLTDASGYIKKIVIEDGITSIGDWAFSYCIYADEVVIPDSVTRIGNGAFSECESLKEIQIPDSVESIGEYAFYFSQYHEDNLLESVKLPQNITSIGEGTFRGCKNLKEITLPDNIISIGKEAFLNCSAEIKVNDNTETLKCLKENNIEYTLLKNEISSPNGDINKDGSFSIADVVLFQKWLLNFSEANLSDWKAADYNNDNKLDVLDLCIMKNELLSSSSSEK